MKKQILIALFLCSSIFVNAQNKDSIIIKQIFNEALMNGKAYDNLRVLCKEIGQRLSGTQNAQKAVEYTFSLMKNYRFDSVWLQEVMVPMWVRGAKETAAIITNDKRINTSICALGGSVACKSGGILAEVIEVKSFSELSKIGKEKIEGKIVFFNRMFDEKYITTFSAYGSAVDQRGSGAIEAAKYGAIGVVVRSMAYRNDPNPHTGAMRYKDSVEKIPACAISTVDAEILSDELKKNPKLKFYFNQNCQTLDDIKSYNVVGKIQGTEKPNEIICVGGHLDSWDLAEGAHDDGAGCVQSIEALRIFKSLNIKPKRTLHAVMFMNEENGLRGGIKYAELAEQNKEKHIAAIESDAGGFAPRGFGIEDSVALIHFQKYIPLLKPYLCEQIKSGHGGSDIGPLKKSGTVCIGLSPDSQRYFDIHHSANDVFENVSRRELHMGAAAMASLIYLISEYGVK